MSGAASGAAAGASVGGPIGAGIGGAIGLATGFFGDDAGDSEARRQAIGNNRNLLSMLEERYQAAAERDPTDTALFQAGSTQAREQAERQAEVDAAQANARGLSGSQFAVAQDANRQRQLARTQRDLLARSDRVQREKERAALQSMLQQRGVLNDLIGRKAAADQRAAARRAAAVQNALSSLGSAALASGGGSGGQAAGSR